MSTQKRSANACWANPTPVESHPLISDWISFNDDNTVSIYSGRVEIGQGIAQSSIQIAAEALSVNEQQIRLISGDTERCPNEGYTAGSLSISQGGMSIRVAAVAASNLFKQALANELSCEVEEITVHNGQFYHRKVNTIHSYWTMALKIDLAVAIPRQLLTHGANDHQSSTQSFSKNALNDLLNGITYIHDFELPDLLHARVLLPPHPHATLDVSAEELLKRLPDGVRLIKINQFIALVSSDEWVAVKTIKQLDDSYQTKWRWPKDSTVSGDQIDTLELLPTETATLVAPQISSTENDNNNPEQPISVSVARPCLLHASIGPSCAIALLNGSQLTVWTHSQGVFPLRGAIANVIDIEEHQVHVIHLPGAGCYGHNGADDAAIDAAIIACQIPDRAIRIHYSRKNEFQHTTLGAAMRSRASASLSTKGTVNSFTMTVTSPPQSSRPRGADVPNARSAALLKDETPSDSYQPFVFNAVPLPSGCAVRNAIPDYDFPAVEVVHEKIARLPYRASSLRSLGAFTNVMAIESLMDECARSANANPVDFRLNHLKDPRAKAVIKNVIEQSGWNGTESGFGVAYARYKNSAAYCASVVKLTVNEEINVEQVWLSVDVGEVINEAGVKAQIEGGAIQAISWTLMEQANLIENSVDVNGWDDYPIIRFSEVPVINVEVLHHPTQPTLGCGEASQGPVGAAILNAVCSELGFRPTRLPITRESLIEQMEISR